MLGHYQKDPLTLGGGDASLPLIEERMTGVLAMAWGVRPWLELDAQLPVLAQWAGTGLADLGIASPARSGVGAPRLAARLGLLRLAADEPVDLAAEVGLGLPVGSASALARDTGTSLLARVMVGGRLGDVLAPAFEAGVLLRPTVVLGTAAVSGDEVGSALRGEVDVNAALSWGQSRGAVELMGGARYAPGPGVELFALGGVGFGSRIEEMKRPASHGGGGRPTEPWIAAVRTRPPR